MNRTIRLFLLLIATFMGAIGIAEVAPSTVESGYTTWTLRLEDPDVRVGEHTRLIIEGQLQPGWHAFGPQLRGDWVEIETDLSQEGNAVEPAGEMVFPPGKIEIVPGFNENGVMYEGAFAFAVPVKILSSGVAVVELRAQNCNDISCDRPRRALLSIPIEAVPGDPRPDRLAAITDVPVQPEGYVEPDESVRSGTAPIAEGEESTQGNGSASKDGAVDEVQDATIQGIQNAQKAGLGPFLLLSFVAGLLALLTPCVWPMIPITVSYFTKKSEGGQSTVKYAVAYCIGIVTTFVGLGLVVTAVLGGSPQDLATSPITNAFLTILFVVLALNLFGLFEIRIPSRFVNKVQGKASAGGFIAPILLGFVFSLTTFTCTVPFVGTILVSATQGDYLYPILGMTAFSLAFAIPFFVLALIPRAIQGLPKSGTWLSAVKNTMGFLELAAALKFASNIDVIVNDPMWLPFAGFAAVWFGLFLVTALYLFGIVKMPHDTGEKVGTVRKLVGVLFLGLALWMLAGIARPQLLGPALAFFPPNNGQKSAGFDWIEDYEEALEQARAQNTPLFINFTGMTCGNCRVMEYQKFPRTEYRQELEKFVLAELYTDRDTPEDNANDKLRTELTKSATNPAYAILTPDGRVVRVYQGLAMNDAEFIEFMQKGFAEASR